MNELQLSGLPVNKIYYATQEPYVTHGQFTAANSSDERKELAVTGALIAMGDRRVAADDLKLYRLPDYQEEEGGCAILAAGETASFEVTFPRVAPAGQRLSDPLQVVLTIAVDGIETTVASPVTFTIRTPRR